MRSASYGLILEADKQVSPKSPPHTAYRPAHIAVFYGPQICHQHNPIDQERQTSHQTRIYPVTMPIQHICRNGNEGN